MKLMRASVAAIAVLGCMNPTLGGIAPDYDFQWATIGSPGNAPYLAEPLSDAYGRGGVGYEYRISRLEITTAQWLEFRNAYTTQSFELRRFAEPGFWAGQMDLDYFGPGHRYQLRSDVPDAGNVAIKISWRDAALYCNWLHNGKGSSLGAISEGAYDASTFGEGPDGEPTDQIEHSPGARYWIPTLDEWLKAAYHDPDVNSPSGDGWWKYPHQSDAPPVPGWPGVNGAQTNAGLDITEEANPQWIPLGSYPDVQSAWGLLDVSGGSSEWLEWWRVGNRGFAGSEAGSPFYETNDRLDGWHALNPEAPFGTLRVASIVPGGGQAIWTFVLFTAVMKRRRLK